MSLDQERRNQGIQSQELFPLDAVNYFLQNVC